jgi:tRNA(Ile2) C34 agmatinyltransferase TiaS
MADDVLDAVFNDVLRAAYGRAGAMLADDTGLASRIAASLGLQYQEPRCPRCGGTGSIGIVSTHRCPEC